MNGHKLLKLTLLALACLSAVLAACQKQKTGEATRQAGPPRTLAEFEKATAGQSPTQIGQFVLKIMAALNATRSLTTANSA